MRTLRVLIEFVKVLTQLMTSQSRDNVRPTDQSGSHQATHAMFPVLPRVSNDCSCSFLYDKNQNSIVRNVRFTFLSLVFIAIFLASDTNLVYKSLD